MELPLLDGDKGVGGKRSREVPGRESNSRILTPDLPTPLFPDPFVSSATDAGQFRVGTMSEGSDDGDPTGDGIFTAGQPLPATQSSLLPQRST
jgi:hypothetical protein